MGVTGVVCCRYLHWSRALLSVLSGGLSQTWAGSSSVRGYAARPVKPHKAKGSRELVQHFVDFRRVQVWGGSGGDGCLSFLSLPRVEYAGPDGGNGGNGGHVIFKATTNVKSLHHVSSIIRGKNGEPGGHKNCHGKNAEHIVIEVPVGTQVRNEEGQVLCSLDQVDGQAVVARGGAGGKGNRFFLSNENRAPAVFEHGAKGESRTLLVELKIMAHAGLIGFPNAGKSSLLRAISRARPKVAAYPFTTLNPHVGMVLYDDYEQIAVADIPGLIQGAHQNRGLGISFLRHIERCACLLFVLDLSPNCQGGDPLQQLEALKFELEQYRSGLSERPHAVVANKMDIPGAAENLEMLTAGVSLPVFPVSARLRTGLQPLLLHLRELYDKHAVKHGTGW